MANPYNSSNKATQQSFWQDTQDVINHSWYGQYVQKEDLIYQLGVNTDQKDNDYDWKQNNDGYQEQTEWMAEQSILNKEHHDALKLHIDLNKERALRMGNTDRIWGPALLGSLFDPLTYTPIPFVKGLGFTKAFVRGGAISAGSVGATEIIRHNYDPLATNEQTIAYVSSAGLFGGIFSGIPAVYRAGVKAKQERTSKFQAKSERETLDFYMEKHNEIEGGIPLDFSIDGKTIKRGYTGHTKTYNTKTGDKTTVDPADIMTSVMANNKRKVSEDLIEYNPVKYYLKDGEEFIDIDEVFIKNQFVKFKNGEAIDGIPDQLRTVIKNENDFVNFFIKKEIIRETDNTWKIGKNYKANEERLSTATAAEIIEVGLTDFSVESGNVPILSFLSEQLDKTTPLGRVSKLFRKNNKVYQKLNKSIHLLVGDYGVKHRFAKRGIAINRSVLLNRDIKWGHATNTLRIDLDKAYNLYVTGSRSQDASVSNPLLGTALDLVNKEQNNKAILKDAGIQLNRKINPNDQLNTEITRKEFQSLISKLQADDVRYQKALENAPTPEAREALENGVRSIRQFYKEFDDEMVKLEMKPTKQKIEKLRQEKKDKIKELQIKEKNATSKEKQQIYSRLKNEYKDDVIEADAMLEEIDTMAPANEKAHNYFHRMWDIENIMKNEEAFKNRLYQAFEDSIDFSKIKLKKNQTQDQYLVDRVEEAFDNIIGHESSFSDSMNIVEYAGKKRIRPLMHRSIEVPNSFFMDVDGVDYILTDSLGIAMHYKNNMGTAIEMTREFGDRNGRKLRRDLEELIADEIDIKDEGGLIKGTATELKRKITGKGPDTLGDLNTVLNTFEDTVMQMYGVNNTLDPMSYNKRFVEALKNATSLSTMGSVLPTSLTEIARPVVVHGFAKIGLMGAGGDLGKAYRSLSTEVMEQVRDQASWIYTHMELQMQGGAMERFVANDLGATSQVGIFSGVSNFLRSAQKPFYYLNGLTPYTIAMKKFSAGVSVHRFIEDSISLANGTINKEGAERLASHGINKRTANMIKKLSDDGVIETVSKDGRMPLYLANAGMWGKTKGGREAARILRMAVRSDVERTIITPNLTDKFNMMHGVIRINNDKVADFLTSSKGARFFAKAMGGGQFVKTARGAKFENAWLTMPLQFYSWVVAAQRKLLMSGLSGRDKAFISGSMYAMLWADFGNKIKNPYHSDKEYEERLLLAFENSGVAAGFSDINRIVESVTSAEHGIRPYTGMEQPYGEPEAHDAYKVLLGAGPGNVLDLYKAFDTGTEYDQKYAIRRMLPLQNLWWFKWATRMLTDEAHPYDPIIEPLLDIERR